MLCLPAEPHRYKRGLKFIKIYQKFITTHPIPSYLVRLVKEQLGMHTLAIGDGANDVSMIQVLNIEKISIRR